MYRILYLASKFLFPLYKKAILSLFVFVFCAYSCTKRTDIRYAKITAGNKEIIPDSISALIKGTFISITVTKNYAAFFSGTPVHDGSKLNARFSGYQGPGTYALLQDSFCRVSFMTDIEQSGSWGDLSAYMYDCTLWHPGSTGTLKVDSDIRTAQGRILSGQFNALMGFGAHGNFSGYDDTLTGPPLQLSLSFYTIFTEK